MSTLAQVIEGPLRRPCTRKNKRQSKLIKVVPLIYGEPRKPTKSKEECFNNPIIIVNIATGQVLVNRVREYFPVY